MSDLTLRKCNICLSEYISLDRVVFFQCGHHACRSCSERKSYREDPFCAECRNPKGPPHRIYLSSDDLVNEPVGRIIDNLGEIDAESSAESIATATEKIRRWNAANRGNTDISNVLLEGVKDLEERVAPLAALYDETKKENQELLKQLQHLESASMVYKTEAARANKKVDLHKATEARLRERAQGYISVIKEKSMDIERLQMELEEREKKANLMRTKLKALAKSQRHESRKASHPGDISLQVEAELVPPTTKRPPTVLQNFNSPLIQPVKRRKRVQQRDMPDDTV